MADEKAGHRESYGRGVADLASLAAIHESEKLTINVLRFTQEVDTHEAGDRIVPQITNIDRGAAKKELVGISYSPSNHAALVPSAP